MARIAAKTFWPISVLATFLFFTFCVEYGEAIKCFQCNSNNESTCLDLKPEDTWSSFYKECPDTHNGKASFCRKMIQTVKQAEGDHERLIRKCGWQTDPRNRECYRVNDDDHSEIVCQCFHDGCNSAPRAAPGIFAVAGIVLVLCFGARIARW